MRAAVARQAGVARRAAAGARTVHAFARLDHLMMHVDEPERLTGLLSRLSVPVTTPATPFAFEDEGTGEEAEFEAKLWSLGGGASLMVYRDDAVAEARREVGLPSGAVGSLALEPASMSRFHAQAALTRAGVMHVPEPISYHVPDRARRLDPSLPPWLFRRVLFPHADIGGAADAVSAGGGGASVGGESLDGLLMSATSSGAPPFHFAYAVSWHRDFAFAPMRRRRSALSALPSGALGVVACPRVFVTSPAARGDDGLLRVAGFWHGLGQAVVQRGRGEVEVRFPGGGPALHVRSVEDDEAGRGVGDWAAASAALATTGAPPFRVSGWEWRVARSRREAEAVLSAAGLPVASVVTDGDAFRIVADLGPAGMHGCALHVVSATAEDRGAQAAAKQELRRIAGGSRGAKVAAACLLDAEGAHTYLLPPPLSLDGRPDRE